MNAMRWALQIRAAIDRLDVETLAILLTANDPNGTYMYDDVCREFGERSIEQWEQELIDCGLRALECLRDHLTDRELTENAEILSALSER